jgi:hypothetical protein
MPIVILNKIGIYSTAKLYAAICAVFGLCAGLFLALFSSAMPINTMFGRSMGIGLALFLPIIYSIVGFVAGAISAAIYNLVARWTGGIRMDMTEVEEVTDLE